jgi:hypothetical protein
VRECESPPSNVENLFDRAKVLKLDWEDGRVVLERYARINQLLSRPAELGRAVSGQFPRAGAERSSRTSVASGGQRESAPAHPRPSTKSKMPRG